MAAGAAAAAAAIALVGAGGVGSAGADSSVTVALGSAANEFSLVLLPAEVPAGDVVLTATNGGAEEHTVALKGGTPTAEIAPGGSDTLAVGTLAPGTYTFVCTIAGHEQLGMKADLLVTGVDATTTTLAAGVTTTTVAAGATTTVAGAGATTTSVAGQSTTSVAGASTTTVPGTTTTSSASGGSTTTVVTAPVSRLSETGPKDVWAEVVGGLVVLNLGYLLWSATRPSRRRGRLSV